MHAARVLRAAACDRWDPRLLDCTHPPPLPRPQQVASNFNCLEVAGAHVNPAGGSFVTDLMTDSTQGPAASSGAAVAAITRTHAAFYEVHDAATSPALQLGLGHASGANKRGGDVGDGEGA